MYDLVYLLNLVFQKKKNQSYECDNKSYLLRNKIFFCCFFFFFCCFFYLFMYRKLYVTLLLCFKKKFFFSLDLLPVVIDNNLTMHMYKTVTTIHWHLKKFYTAYDTHILLLLMEMYIYVCRYVCMSVCVFVLYPY